MNRDRHQSRQGRAAPLGCLTVAALCWAMASEARELIRPAELPPAAYKGQQYVDSKGCAFLRAGFAGKTVWVARVTQKGVPLCGYPPSGKRVAVVGDATVAAPPPPPPPSPPPATASDPDRPVTGGGLLVAVGSYSKAENAESAERRLAALGLPVHRGSVVRRGAMLVTVFAGPFQTQGEAEAARRSVRGAGFEEARIQRY